MVVRSYRNAPAGATVAGRRCRPAIVECLPESRRGNPVRIPFDVERREAWRARTAPGRLRLGLPRLSSHARRPAAEPQAGGAAAPERRLVDVIAEATVVRIAAGVRA